MKERPNNVEYYLGIASAVARKSPCVRRKYGAVIVVDDAVVSTGYNGPARGSTNCEEGCVKDILNEPHGTGYEFCPAVHAEENTITNAARHGSSVKNGTLYISGYDVKSGEKVEAVPCKRCRRILINAGIKKVVIDTPNGPKEFDVEKWVEEDKRSYEELCKRLKEELFKV